jgi:parallel beta-helix repeat protein
MYVGYCSGIKIKNNTIKDNKNCGIELQSARNIFIKSNLIVENGDGCCPQAGIYISHSDISNISKNYIKNNVDFEIKLVNSNENIFYTNSIKHRKENVIDDLGNTFWDNDVYGNHWLGYDFIDKNNDGIGDLPYTIYNDVIYDRYPLTEQPHGVPSYNEEPTQLRIEIISNSTDLIYVGETIFFYGKVNTPKIKINSWRWEFEDGDGGFENQTYKNFNTTGSHILRLTVLSENHTRVTTDISIIVYDVENETIGFEIIFLIYAIFLVIFIKKISAKL